MVTMMCNRRPTVFISNQKGQESQSSSSQRHISSTETALMMKRTEEQPESDNGYTTDNDKFFLALPIEPNQEKTNPQMFIGLLLKEPFVEISEASAVLLSSLLAALSTLDSINFEFLLYIIRVEYAIAYIFAIDFFVRWYSQFSWKGIVQYLTQPLVVVDLFVVILPLIPLLVPNATQLYNSILPTWLFSSSGGLINLRLLRILRLQRVLTDIDTFADFQRGLGILPSSAKDEEQSSSVQPYKLQLARVILSIFTLLSVSSGLIYSTEHTVNPDIPDYFTALYFGLTTLTTVGFGDITPVTWEGKLVVCCSILAGVAILPAQTAGLVDALLERQNSKQTEVNNGGDSSSTKEGDTINKSSSEVAASMISMKNTITSVEKGDIDLGKDEDDTKKDETKDDSTTSVKLSDTEADEFCAWFQVTLNDKVSSCKVTNCLTSSPAVVTNNESGAMRKMMQYVETQGVLDAMPSLPKQTVEINVEHDLITGLNTLRVTQPELAQLCAEQIYDNCLVAAGLLDDGRSMLGRLNDILLRVVTDGSSVTDANDSNTNNNTSSSTK